MKQYMTNAAEREQDAQKVEAGEDEGQPVGSARRAARARTRGRRRAQNTPTPSKGHWSAKGDAQPAGREARPEHALKRGADFGMIGLLNSAAMSRPERPRRPLGQR